ncbi:MAG: hypothetical protein ABW048_10585 [Sphingobium sp.]
MATRLLLTLLALLTGLAAQFAPAQARVCGSVGTEIGASVGMGVVQVCKAAVAVQASPAQSVSTQLPLVRTTGPIVCQATPATVRQGIDRARE